MNKKHVLRAVLCLCLSFLTYPSLFAQNIIWGHQAPTGQAAGEFQNGFVQSTTAGSYTPAQWTALSISHGGGTVVPGAAYWVRTITGVSQGGFATGTPPANSTTIGNGAAIFDSDFLDNAGDPTTQGLGVAPAVQKGELISPRIDLAAYADSALVLSFHSYYRYFALTEYTLSLSTDDGLTWGNVTDITAIQPTGQNTSVEGRIRVLLPNFTSGVANLTQCRLKFTFEGDYYFAIIDDVSFEVAPEYDIALGVADPAAPTFFSVGNLIRMGGNAYQSYWNIDFNNPVGWSWGAKVINRGAQDLPTANRPRLYCSVSATDALTGIVTPNVYLDSIIYTDTIPAEDMNGVAIEKDMTPNDMLFIKNQANGTEVRYTVRYWVAHDGVDGSAANDTTAYSFVIRNDNYDPVSVRYEDQYTSKARLAASDGRVFASTPIFPGGGPHSSFEFGSVYYFPYGAADNLTIDSLDFRYFLTSGFSGASTQTIFANVYKYEDGTNGGAADGSISADELTQIGIGSTTLTGLGSSIAGGGFHLATFTSFVDAGIGGPMPALDNNSFYYISVQISPSLTGGAATFGANDVPIHGTDQLNYAMNMGKGNTTAPFAPSTMRVTNAAGADNWFDGFNGFDEVPSIGIFYSMAGFDNVIPVEEEVIGSLQLYPNPAQDILQVALTLENTQDVQYIITDVSGRVVYYDKSANVDEEVATIDVSALASGVYLVTTQTDQGVMTKQFIKK